ncbi:Retrovirus-related Pol polyprotein from transposon [Apostichopus japonicus]|uniref:Retrovirus-related Pol polyprotein from transposon n=1 Tax=Stichopus japonicus TaxID=307972 RepID=A0A2G8JFQ0_STIJA|nr:Retrovirus-related Pol polyprotein from transposon [Apostichopus japonicus]
MGQAYWKLKPGVPESRHVMVGRALVDTSRRTVPIRLLNGTSNPVTLYKGTHVGIVSPIANVVEVDEVENNYTSGLPAEMEDLLHRSGEGVPDCERIRLRQFLQEIFVTTDHGSLRWLYNFKSPEGQVARWLEVLGTYDFQIETRPGRVHANADALSRSDPPCIGVPANPPIETPGLCNIVTADSNWVESCTKEQLRGYQLKDSNIGPVLNWKESGSRPPWEQISGLDRAAKAYWGQWDLLSIKDGVLYRRWVSNTGAHDRDVIVMPQVLREDVLYELHILQPGVT